MRRLWAAAIKEVTSTDASNLSRVNSGPRLWRRPLAVRTASVRVARAPAGYVDSRQVAVRPTVWPWVGARGSCEVPESGPRGALR